MASDLQDLGNLLDEQTKEMPPMMLEQNQMDTIIEEWDTLRDYGMSKSSLYLDYKRLLYNQRLNINAADHYRQIAYLTDEPQHTTLDDYLKDLDKIITNKNEKE